MKGVDPPAKPTPDYIFANKSIFLYVLEVLQRIRISDLESALKFLNFSYTKKLLFYLEHFIRHNIEIELSTKVLFFLLRQYEPQIKGCEELRKPVLSIYQNLRSNIGEVKELIGVNLAGL